MAISYVGGGTGTTSATLPTHQVGDLIVVFAYRDGSTTAPSLPSSPTYQNITSSGANTNSIRVGYRVATSTSETTGTWTNATRVDVHVYRGVDGTTPIGGGAVGGAASTSVAYNTFTLTVTDGTSWVVGFAGHRSVNTTLENAPTGMTNRTTAVDANSETAGHDTNGGVSSWSTQTVSVGGTSSGWRSYTLELLSGSRSMTGGQASFTVTGQSAGGNLGNMGGDAAPLPHIGLLFAPASGYTLAADQVSFTHTGQDASFATKYTADVTSFAETGQAATFALSMPASHGSYTYTGYDAQLSEGGSGTEAPAPFPHLSLILQQVDNTTLTGETGSFAVTGQASVLAVTLPGANASFTLTGQNATFAPAIVGGHGAFILTGYSAGTADTLVADQASFTLSGQTSVLAVKMPAAQTSYAFTGQNATLIEGNVGGAENPAPFPHLSSIMGEANPYSLSVGSFAVTGQATPLNVGLVTAHGTYTHTGQDATFRAGFSITAEMRPYTVTGFETDPENTILRIGMRAGEGVYALTGQDAAFDTGGSSLSLAADFGDFSLSEIDAPLSVMMPGEGQSFTTTGQTAVFRLTLQTEHYSVALTGQSVVLDVLMPSEYRAVSHTGESASFNISLVAETATFPVVTPSEFIEGETGTFTATGQNAPLNITLSAEVADFAVDGQDTEGTVGGTVVLTAEAASYTFTGQNANLTDRSQEPMTYGGVAKRRTYRYFGASYDEVKQDIKAIVVEDTPQGAVHKEILWKPDVSYVEFQKEVAALQADLAEDEEFTKAIKKLQRKRNQRKVIALLLH